VISEAACEVALKAYHPHLRKRYEALVPLKMRHEAFWCHYFGHVKAIKVLAIERAWNKFNGSAEIAEIAGGVAAEAAEAAAYASETGSGGGVTAPGGGAATAALDEAGGMSSSSAVQTSSSSSSSDWFGLTSEEQQETISAFEAVMRRGIIVACHSIDYEGSGGGGGGDDGDNDVAKDGNATGDDDLNGSSSCSSSSSSSSVSSSGGNGGGSSVRSSVGVNVIADPAMAASVVSAAETVATTTKAREAHPLRISLEGGEKAEDEDEGGCDDATSSSSSLSLVWAPIGGERAVRASVEHLPALLTSRTRAGGSGGGGGGGAGCLAVRTSTTSMLTQRRGGGEAPHNSSWEVCGGECLVLDIASLDEPSAGDPGGFPLAAVSEPSRLPFLLTLRTEGRWALSLEFRFEQEKQVVREGLQLLRDTALREASR
jgi:hypothetical protein